MGIALPYYVYVIELDPSAFIPDRKFRNKNPHIWGEGGSGLVTPERFFYVGQSAHEPACRFEQHKECFGEDIFFECICGMECSCCAGPHIITRKMSNKYVREHGMWLRRRKYQRHNPMDTQEKSKSKEEDIAEKLRREGNAAYSA